jgi:hypothetical protein
LAWRLQVFSANSSSGYELITQQPTETEQIPFAEKESCTRFVTAPGDLRSHPRRRPLSTAIDGLFPVRGFGILPEPSHAGVACREAHVRVCRGLFCWCLAAGCRLAALLLPPNRVCMWWSKGQTYLTALSVVAGPKISDVLNRGLSDRSWSLLLVKVVKWRAAFG